MDSTASKSLPLEILRSVRVITLVTSKHRVDETSSALRGLLEVLPELQTIQVLHCKTLSAFSKVLKGLAIPTVTTLVTPTETANGLTLTYPNTTHIRCAGGVGGLVVGGLKFIKKCQILDGMIDWVKDLKLVDRLVKNAPSTLHTLEIRRPVNSGLGILSQNTAPTEWVQVMSKLPRLKGLRKLILTFPKSEEEPSDIASIDAAKKVMTGLASSSGESATLIVRSVIAPHYSPQLRKEDYVVSEDVIVL
ncbi:hypothetical protein F5146DRAFT_1139734 [Armillaria mellea]|nr:hypothetical protein F5146DRAFT_1139734 [Armillaria mellea]